MVAVSPPNIPKASPNRSIPARDSKGRILSVETLTLQELDGKDVDAKAWIGLQISLLMRASVRLASVSIPTAIDRLLIYEKLMLAHIERGFKLFGLGNEAGKHTLVLCVDPGTQERIAQRALAAGPAGVDAQAQAADRATVSPSQGQVVPEQGQA